MIIRLVGGDLSESYFVDCKLALCDLVQSDLPSVLPTGSRPVQPYDPLAQNRPKEDTEYNIEHKQHNLKLTKLKFGLRMGEHCKASEEMFCKNDKIIASCYYYTIVWFKTSFRASFVHKYYCGCYSNHLTFKRFIFTFCEVTEMKSLFLENRNS